MVTVLQYLLISLQLAARALDWIETSKIKEAYRKVLAENVSRRIKDAQAKVNKILKDKYGVDPIVPNK
jgi:hypothetical protein